MGTDGKFTNTIQVLIDAHKKGNPEPLDGDEVEELATLIKNIINLQEGNITEAEYVKLNWRIR